MPRDTLNPEEEYFHREDMERLRKLREKADAEKAASDREALKALHAGRCGKCGGKLNARLFKGVEIDICPDCGAVLLDPGELETLVGEDRSSGVSWLTDFFSFSKNR